MVKRYSLAAQYINIRRAKRSTLRGFLRSMIVNILRYLAIAFFKKSLFLHIKQYPAFSQTQLGV